jgi:hypothetical protein
MTPRNDEIWDKPVVRRFDLERPLSAESVVRDAFASMKAASQVFDHLIVDHHFQEIIAISVCT